MKYSLEQKLIEYSKSDAYPFHMPGHKRNLTADFDPYRIDITEINGFDDLQNPKGILRELVNQIKETYESDYANFLVNGSTSGNLAAIFTMAKPKEKLIVASNCHKSVFHGLLLRDCNVALVEPDILEGGLYQGLSAKKIKDCINDNPDAKGVIITSPTYEGLCSDISEIAEVCHNAKIPLCVDAAHGAHFGFGTMFPKNAISENADIVVMSLHKTLPSLTQTAIICGRNNGLVDFELLNRHINMFVTSSPSYVFMVSAERCMDFLNRKDSFEEYESNLSRFYEKAKTLENIRILHEKNQDLSKIVIFPNISSILREKYSLELEMESMEYCIAMTSPLDTREGFERLLEALKEIDSGVIETKPADKITYDLLIDVSENKEETSIGQAYYGKKIKKKVDEATGAIAACFLYAYPPGIPVLIPGKTIKKENIRLIDEYKTHNLSIVIN